MLSLLDIIRQQVVHFSVSTAPPAPYLLWIHIFLQAGEKSGSEIDWRGQVCLSPLLWWNLHRHLVQWLLAAVLIISLAFPASTARFFLRGLGLVLRSRLSYAWRPSCGDGVDEWVIAVLFVLLHCCQPSGSL